MTAKSLVAITIRVVLMENVTLMMTLVRNVNAIIAGKAKAVIRLFVRTLIDVLKSKMETLTVNASQMMTKLLSFVSANQSGQVMVFYKILTCFLLN